MAITSTNSILNTAFAYTVPTGTVYENSVLNANNQWISLGTLPTGTPIDGSGEWINKLDLSIQSNKENTNMAEFNMERSQRDYATGSLSTLYYDKEYDLRKKYGISADTPPHTAKELVDRITAGKYIIRTGELHQDNYWERSIIWRDPSIKEDRDGYEVAYKKLEAAVTKAKCKAQLSPISDLLKVVEEFETFDATK